MIDAGHQRITALEKKVGPDAKSPLFVQLAQYYLEANRAQDALRVCDAGLANFPFYTTGHLINGKALAALNLRSEARREFEFVLGFLPNNVTIATLLTQIPPGEDESISAAPQQAQEEISQPEPQTSSGYEYTTPSPATEHPEPSYSEQSEPEASPSPSPSPGAESSSGSSFFDAITQASSTGTPETSLGFSSDAPPAETPVAPETFAGFDFPSPAPSPYSESSPPSAEQPSGFDFTMPAPDIPVQASFTQEESFEQYATRRRGELPGENTLSLEDYFNSAGAVNTQGLVDLQFSGPEPVEPMSAGVENQIEELANKLQSAGKITPVINFAQKETTTASEQDTPASMGFVTPTLAEIYAKQGWYDDAIKAYKTLARNKPSEKERYEKRIAELEELKNQGSS